MFCNRVVKGISDHFIMQIKLFYCNRNLTLLWQSERNRVGMVVFNDTEWFSLIEVGLEIAKNITTGVSYQVKSPFSCLCHILSSVMSNSSNHGKNRSRAKHAMRDTAPKSWGITNHDTSTTGHTQLLCATCSTVSPPFTTPPIYHLSVLNGCPLSYHYRCC